MSKSANELAALIGEEAHYEMNDAVGAIKHCFAQLTEEQVWWRSDERMNSIGNLVLHVCGNMHQWIVSGVGGAANTRRRQSEFDERGPIENAELLQRLDDTLREVAAVLEQLSPELLAEKRIIQAHDVTCLQAILHSMAHLRGHTQEIVHITRHQLGEAYKFAFVPTPEQGGE